MLQPCCSLGPDSSVVEPISEASYGYWKRSGKLLVVHSLLKMWYRQSHRALIFSQTKQVRPLVSTEGLMWMYR